MAVVVCTVYERDDPPVKGGSATPLGTITELLEFSAREVLSTHGFNTVQLAVNRHDTSAALIENHPGRWVTIAFPAIQTDPVMTVRLGPSHTVVLGENESQEIIHVGGLGILSLGEDAKLLNTVHAPDQPCRGSCPTIPERWSWRAGLAVPIAYGGIIVRSIEEGENQTGTPLAPWNITFDRDNTTAGPAWPDIVAEIQEPVGISMIGLYRRIAEAGDVFLVERPDFDIDGYSAFGQGTFGTDRTSATFASDKVRIYAAADDADSNLLTGLEEEGEDEPFTHVLVKGMGDTYAQVAATWYTSGPARWASIEYTDTDDTALLARVGAEWLRRQFTRTVAREVEIKPGDDPTNGRYLPWKHLIVGDLHTIDAGGIDIRVELVPGAHDATTDDAHRSLRVVLEYNEATGEDGEGIDSLGGTGEPGNCCGPRPPLQPTPPTPGDVWRFYFTGSATGVEIEPDADWDAFAWSSFFPPSTVAAYQLTGNPAAGSSDGTTPWATVSPNVNDDIIFAQDTYPLTGDLLAVIQAGGATVRMQAKASSRYGIGISEATQDILAQLGVRVVSSDGSTVRGTALPLHSLTSSAGSRWPPQSTKVNRVFPPPAADNVLDPVAGAQSGDLLVFEIGGRNFKASGATGGNVALDSTAAYGADLPENETETQDLRAWIEIIAADSPGSPGDVPGEVVRPGDESIGTPGGPYAPIDHSHPHGLLSSDEAHMHDADQIGYDNTNSGLDADNLQAAIDELAADVTTGGGLPGLLRAHTHGLFLGAFHDRALSPAAPVIMGSFDGKDWTTLANITTDNSGTTYAGDPTLMHWRGKFWLTHQYSTSSGKTKFTLLSSEDLSTWTEVTEVTTGVSGATEVYPGTWVRNEDGTVYLDPDTDRPVFILTVSTNASAGAGPFVPYEMHPTNDAMTTWSSAVEIDGDFPADIIDPFVIKHGDEWAFWYKSNDPGDEVVEYATCSTLLGTYAVQQSGNWAGWGTAREAPCLVKLPDGVWRIYIQKYSTQTDGQWYSESTDDWATWSTLTQLTTDLADDDTLGHGDVIYLPGIYDHLRDPGAQAAAVTEADVRDAGRWELLMQDGVSSPPVPLTNEDGTDWLYGWVSD